MDFYGTIYKFKNRLNQKMYIGQTTRTVEKRVRDHLCDKRNRHISNSIRKNGIQNFEVEEIYCALTKEELNNAEIYFVKEYQTMFPLGYNHRAGGNQNGICSDELKRKISQSKMNVPNYKKRGEKRSEQYRIKISRGLGGQRIIGINQTTGEIRFYETAHSTRLDGHNPSNVIQICKKRRKISKNFVFYYESDYANQSGSLEIKESEHAQRIGPEPT